MTCKIQVQSGQHVNAAVLKLVFPFDQVLADRIRTLPGVKWSRTMGCWYLPDSNESRAVLQEMKAWVELDTSKLDQASDPQQQRLAIVRYSKDRMRLTFEYDPALVARVRAMSRYFYDAGAKTWMVPHTEENLEILKGYCVEKGMQVSYSDEWAERKVVRRSGESGNVSVECPIAFINKLKELRYSESTVRNYASALKEFIGFLGDHGLDSATGEDIERFLLYITTKRFVSTSYHNMAIGAIRFYFEKVLNRPEVIVRVERPRREKTLPEVLSEDEVVCLFRSIDNIKHRCILMTVYSAGLRLSEVVALKTSDIDSKRMMIFVKGAKGKKDRYTVLSRELLKWLRTYYKVSQPKQWLFEGATGGQYSMGSVQSIMREAVLRAGIRKHATVHTLRHSFATHMLESGTDLRYIQSLLGHSSSKTTEIYTHITTRGLEKIRSPFDRLKITGERDESGS